MKIKIDWTYVQGEPDTEEMELLCIPARKSKNESDAALSFRVPDSGYNFRIAKISTGNAESSNLLCKEIAKRWNEYQRLVSKEYTQASWVAVDKDGKEGIYSSKPIIDSNQRMWVNSVSNSDWVDLPKGSIKKLIGRDLFWGDEPVELKEK